MLASVHQSNIVTCVNLEGSLEVEVHTGNAQQDAQPFLVTSDGCYLGPIPHVTHHCCVIFSDVPIW